mmetsp:Transcript_55401/g.64794  ORF Transcript_55401/g.64794 Transcript_55401/m.64794 type:complete len:85 (+) Transcript_55401:201-455(+)
MHGSETTNTNYRIVSKAHIFKIVSQVLLIEHTQKHTCKYSYHQPTKNDAQLPIFLFFSHCHLSSYRNVCDYPKAEHTKKTNPFF